MKSTLRPAVLAVALAVASSAAFAAPAASAKPGSPAKAGIAIPDIPFTKFVLNNGLTVIVHEDHKTPVVAVNTWYHVGSKNEKVGKTGFAHLFEHLMFSGSNNFDKTYIKAMEAIGATNLNGTTNNDRTNYFENVPTSMLDYVLFAESDRMGHLLGVLDKKKLDLQRGVVQNEKRQGENRPYGLAWSTIVENTYPAGHPYSWSVIGSMKDLDAASMEDVTEWFKTYYGPNNTTIVLAGDITPEQAREKVEKYFGEIPAGPPLAKHASWIAKRTGTHRTILQDRVPQARTYRVWNVPGAHTAESTLLDLGASVLGQGNTSRLYKRLVHKDQLATSASAYNYSSEIGGQVHMVLTARTGVETAKMEAAADQELRAMLKDGITAQELERARTHVLANYTRMMERVGGFGGKSDLLAKCQTFTGKPDCYKDYLAQVKAATPASVQKALRQWMSDGDYVLEFQPFPDKLTTTAKLDRSKTPSEGKAESLKLPPMQKATLSNGLKVVLAERHDAPVVDFNLMLDGGFASETDANRGMARLMLRMLEQGTPRRDSLRIGEDYAALGAQYGSGLTLDGSRIHMNTLKANMPQALDVYADLVQNPLFPQKELDRLKQDQLAVIKREKADANQMGERVMPTLLFGKGHPYATAWSGSGTEASVQAITRDAMVDYYKRWFMPNNATLLVVGDTTLAELMPELEKKFGAWKAGIVPAKQVAEVAAADKPVVYLVDKPGALQSVIFAGQLTIPLNAPDSLPLSVVNTIFGGNFSSRINMNLREDKHWSYGVYAYVADTVGQRPYISVSSVQTDKTQESMQELLKEYASIADGKSITAAELAAAQASETLSLPGGFETAGQLSGAYRNILQYKLPEDYYDKYTGNITSLTPEKANALAARLITPGKLTWVVVGDLSKVEAGVRALNLGEVRKLDADGNLLP